MTSLTELREQRYRYSLFAALRLVEQLHPDRPRLGEARRASDDPVRLGQPPHLEFAPSDLSFVGQTENGTLKLEQYGFGVFGPNGALPLHMTEYALDRKSTRL